MGVEGLIINQSAGATIQNAIAGRFISIETIGNVQDSTAVYARAENGSNSNYSLFGAAGAMYNIDPIVSSDYVRGERFLLEAKVLADIDGAFHRLWTQDGNIALRLGTSETVHTRLSHRFSDPALSVDYAIIDISGIRSNAKFHIGANTLADADGAFHRLWTAGGNIWAQGSNGLTFLRNAETRIASADASTTFASFGASGAAIRMDTFADNAAALAGNKSVGTLYKTSTGEVRIVV